MTTWRPDITIQEAVNERWDAIVIGSGIGGLTAAAFLAQAGVRPLVLEKHWQPGGYSQSFRRMRMFDFDVGVHILGDCGPGGIFPTLLDQLGLSGEVEFVPLDPDGFETTIFPDRIFRVPAGWDQYRQRLLQTFPERAAAINGYVDLLQAVAGLFTGTPPPSPFPLQDVLPRPATMVALGEVFDALGLESPVREVLATLTGTYALPPSRAPAALHAFINDDFERNQAPSG